MYKIERVNKRIKNIAIDILFFPRTMNEISFRSKANCTLHDSLLLRDLKMENFECFLYTTAAMGETFHVISLKKAGGARKIKIQKSNDPLAAFYQISGSNTPEFLEQIDGGNSIIPIKKIHYTDTMWFSVLDQCLEFFNQLIERKMINQVATFSSGSNEILSNFMFHYNVSTERVNLLYRIFNIAVGSKKKLRNVHLQQYYALYRMMFYVLFIRCTTNMETCMVACGRNCSLLKFKTRTQNTISNMTIYHKIYCSPAIGKNDRVMSMLSNTPIPSAFAALQSLTSNT